MMVSSKLSDYTRRFLNCLFEKKDDIFIDIRKIWFIVGLFLSACSRIPFIFIGFGEADAWRVANAVINILTSGKYEVSRFPGFPIYEWLSVLTIRGHWYACNSLMIVIFFISVLVFYKIVKVYSCNYPRSLALVYSLLPSSIVFSAETMDYFLAILFILLCWLFLKKNRTIISAIFMGLAIGTRLTSLIFLLFPLILLFKMYYNRQEVKHSIIKIGLKILGYVVLVLAISCICFIANFLTYGLSFLSSSGAKFEYTNLTLYSYFINIFTNSYRLFGLMGGIGLIIIFIIFLKNYKTIFQWDSLNLEILPLILLSLILFLIFPFKEAYLLPVIPPLLIFFARNCKKYLFITISLLLLAPNVFNYNIYEKSIDLLPGRVYRERNTYFIATNTILEFPAENNSVLVVASYVDGVNYYLKIGYIPAWGENCIVVYIINENMLTEYQLNNRTIYYLQGIEEWHLLVTGIDLEDFGIVIPFEYQ